MIELQDFAGTVHVDRIEIISSAPRTKVSSSSVAGIATPFSNDLGILNGAATKLSSPGGVRTAGDKSSTSDVNGGLRTADHESSISDVFASLNPENAGDFSVSPLDSFVDHIKALNSG